MSISGKTLRKTVSVGAGIIACIALMLCMAACNGATTVKPARGTVEGSTYSSEYLGLSFDAPKDWSLMSDEDLGQVIGTNGSSVVADAENFETQLNETSGGIMEMGANDKNGNSLVLMMTKGSWGSQVFTDPVDLCKVIADGAKKEFATSGLNVKEADVSEVDFAGAKTPACTLSVSYSGVSFSQRYIVLKKDDVFSIVLMTVMGEDAEKTCDELAAAFSAI